MASDRALQEQYLANDSDRAGWLASKASDAAAEQRVEDAVDLFRQSAAIYTRASLPRLGQLVLLKACVRELEYLQTPACNSQQLQAGYQQIQSLQASIHALEGKYLWAKLLAREGELETARSMMAALISDILFFRQNLPGVLGAWYLDARREIFDYQMRLILGSDADSETIALDSLLALNQLRNSGLSQAAEVTASNGERRRNEDFRLLLAQREQASTPEARDAAQRNIDLWLLGQEQDVTATIGPDRTELRNQLRRLPDDWSLLTYHFLDDEAYAWVGNAEGLTLVELGSGGLIQGLIKDANTGVRTFNHSSNREDLHRLGELLLKPVQDQLRLNVLFVGSGELSDFPLEALVADDEPMIRKHNVVNILSVAGFREVIEHLQQPFDPQHLFLAGNPSTQNPDQQPLAGAASELENLKQRFRDKDVTMVRGTGLDRLALNSDAFSKADLIHIASHATIDREYPELSRIALSTSRENKVEYVTPAELNRQQIAAQLVVLSACSTAGLNRFEYDSHLGFVSKFLQLGSPRVIASLWPVSDRATAGFLGEFYAQLAAEQDVAKALRSAKLKQIDSGQADVRQWAAFQLFSR